MGNLVANSHGSLYNGVSQQPASMRGTNQVEEMYNVYPSIEYGAVRREPLQQPDGSVGTLPVMSTSDSDSYTKMIIDGKSVYQLNINSGIPEIVQLEPFYKVLRVGDGITISSTASQYLASNIGGYKRTQFATTTIKNTTLISNDTVIPLTTPFSTKIGLGADQYALLWVKHADAALGIDYTVTINGTNYKTDQKDRGIDSKSYAQPSSDIGAVSYEVTYPAPIRPTISPRSVRWDSDRFTPVWNDTPVYLSGAGWTAGLWYGEAWMTAGDIAQANAYTAAKDAREAALTQLYRDRDRRNRLESAQDKLDAWINQDIKGPTNTEDATAELVSKIRSAGYVVHEYGSMFVIETNGEDVSTTDSFGNNAISLFYRDIPGTELLPAKVYDIWKFLKFRVKQETAEEDVAYWVRWSGSVWEETQEDDAVAIDNSTMPIEMKVTFYESGSIASVDIAGRDWDDRAMGDAITNEGPGFLNDRPIRDIFFYRNRLGFLSDSGISMTESGNHSNLWRSTAITTLDSDPIDFIVSTNSSTALRHTVMNQDKIFIFADNVQFVMDGGAVFGPKSVKVNEVSHYILDLDIEPIVSDNKIIMVGGTDKSTIVYEYVYNQSYGIAEATALTAHVPGYIMKDAVCLAASNEDDMIFIIASDHRETLHGLQGVPVFGDILTGDAYLNSAYGTEATEGIITPRRIVYGYKFSDSGNQRVQSAWFKWNYRGSVLQVTAARGILYLDIDHEFGADQTLYTIGDGTWDMNLPWDMTEMNWNMTEVAYLQSIQTQRRFAKQALRPPFLESVTNDYEIKGSIFDDTITLLSDYKDFGHYVNRAYIDLGEFIFKDRASKRYSSASTMLKTINLKTDPSSLHTILIRNLDTSRVREVGPLANKKFKGIGLASNFFTQEMQRVNVDGRNTPDGTTFDTIGITVPQNIGGTIYSDRSIESGDVGGAFDSAEIANTDGDEVPQNNAEKANLFGQDVPVMVGGSNASTRVVISSYADEERDYGFRIHDIIQEARVNQRFNLA